MIIINNKFKDTDQFQQLKKKHSGQRKYRARNDAYVFDLFDDVWQLGTKKKVPLDWMYDNEYDWQTFLQLRVFFAEMAAQRAPNTVDGRVHAFKLLGNRLSLPAFKIAYPSLLDSYKKSIVSALFFAVNHARLTFFDDIHQFAQENRPSTRYRGANILDAEKGMYSEVEYQSIKKGMRVATSNEVKLTSKDDYGIRNLLSFCNLMICQLLSALVRRPVQLDMIKWADVLPVGQKFANHRKNKDELTPQSEYTFSDVDVFHVRVFKGKNGTFRKIVEKTSIRLEPELSALLLLYRVQYESVLRKTLVARGIDLNDDELREIIWRCPLFPEEQLFTIEFLSKDNLFKAVSVMSDAFHKGEDALSAAITSYSSKFNIKSDRVDDESVSFGNNRLRHTVLSLGALQGLTTTYLAKITDVTEKAVKPYVELSYEARLMIDQAFADKDVLRRFGSVSVNELLAMDEFVVRNEFDEEMGAWISPSDCNSCGSKLGAPMSCYPCDNFVAKEDADHHQYLDKALMKIKVNKVRGNKLTLKKLEVIILYIRATINICEERKLDIKGLCHE